MNAIYTVEYKDKRVEGYRLEVEAWARENDIHGVVLYHIKLILINSMTSIVGIHDNCDLTIRMDCG